MIKLITLTQKTTYLFLQQKFVQITKLYHFSNNEFDKIYEKSLRETNPENLN